MRQRRLLLAATALTFGCSKSKPDPEPLPGNPKGSFYDAAMPVAIDAEVRPLPGNPKGSFYDAGIEPTAPLDAAAAPADASAAPKDAAIKKKPPDAQLRGNPKGSLYDTGLSGD